LPLCLDSLFTKVAFLIKTFAMLCLIRLIQ
jgi:hypothetical protein